MGAPLSRGTSPGLRMPLAPPCNRCSVLWGQADSPGGGEGAGLSEELHVGGTSGTSGSTVSSTNVEPGAVWRVHLLGTRLVITALVLCLLI